MVQWVQQSRVVGLLALLSVSHGVIQQQIMSKVVGVRVSSTYCLLHSAVLDTDANLALNCGLRCLMHEYCLFFCIHLGDRSCVLYNWYVAQRWKGDTSGTTYSACYSAWADRGDVVKISYPTNAYTTISSNSTSYTSSTMEQVYNFGSVAVSYKENVAVINPPVVGCYVLIRSAHTSVNMELCEIQIIKA